MEGEAAHLTSKFREELIHVRKAYQFFLYSMYESAIFIAILTVRPRAASRFLKVWVLTFIGSLMDDELRECLVPHARSKPL